MSDDSVPALRMGKELLAATRPFTTELRVTSWWSVSSTFVGLGVVLGAAAFPVWWPLRLSLSLIGGLLLVRAFILFHDFQHGCLLRNSRFAKLLFTIYGLVALTPPKNWRHNHNFHHANVGKPISSEEGDFSLVMSDVGAFPLMTTEMWQGATMWQRVRYRLSRHVMTILCAYVTVFLGGLCLAPLIRDPRRNGECVLSLLLHAGVIVLLISLGGVTTLFFSFLLPFALATSMGAYLFFAQHNFTGMRIVPIKEWSHYRAALESSSFMQLGPVMRWFTGNIGYHHIHHLNALIPFYRLPEAMASIPELQHPMTTSLRPHDILACLRLNLWDSKKQRLVRYCDAAIPNSETSNPLRP